jgi:hypothetical protein
MHGEHDRPIELAAQLVEMRMVARQAALRRAQQAAQTQDVAILNDDRAFTHVFSP